MSVANLSYLCNHANIVAGELLLHERDSGVVDEDMELGILLVDLSWIK